MPGDIDDGVRRHLATLARRSRARVNTFSFDRPVDWRPASVRNPNPILDDHFNEETAWDFIATCLERGEHVTEIELNQPRGAKGYEMVVDMGAGEPDLYIKLELGSGQVIARSFHYSEY